MLRLAPSLILACFFSLSTVAVASYSFADCPQSTVYVLGKNGVDVQFELTDATDALSSQVSYGRGTHASFDRFNRTIEAFAEIWSDEASYHFSRATVVEHFQLVGVPSTPVTFRLVFGGSSVSDSACRTACVTSSGRLEAGGQTQSASGGMWMSVPFLEITTTMTAGQPLEVTYEITAEGWGNEPFLGVTGRLDVIGLAIGAEIVPCSSLLPVDATTWGAVKALYR